MTPHPSPVARADIARFRPKSPPPSPAQNAMSVDVEDYFQVQAFADRFGRGVWDNQPCRVERNTDKVLEISSAPAFLDHVNHLAARWQEELDALQRKRSGIMAGHEGLGLMRALVLHDELAGPVLTKTAYDHDLLLIYANHDTRRVQFLPPLTMAESDIPLVAARLNKALQQVSSLAALSN